MDKIIISTCSYQSQWQTDVVLIAKTVHLISTGVDLDLQDDESHGFVLDHV